MADHLEDLREAAEILRGRSMCASAGPWQSGEIVNGEHYAHYGDFGWVISGPAGSPETDDSEQGKADALYIATMNPLVGLAIADWLDEQVYHYQNIVDAAEHHAVHRMLLADLNAMERRFGHALRVARLILGRTDAEA